ncbi:MAG: chemotaxis protein CheA [Oscillospiraceae bacterium]|nr:chemotaxis protein CheA [Oscillospiraceae bacterium]
MNNDMMEAYLYEMNTQLEQLEEIVLAAENAGSFSQEDVNEIFRIMHTVKGSSAMMEFNSLMTVSHNIEDLFFLIRDKGMDVVSEELKPELFDLIFKSIDFFRGEVGKLENNEPLSDSTAGFLETISSFSKKISVQEGGAPAANDAQEEESAPQETVSGNCEYGSPDFPNALQIFFDEGSGMENLRAMMLVNAVKDFVEESQFDYYPGDLKLNPDTGPFIVEHGFYLRFRSDGEREKALPAVRDSGSVRSYQKADYTAPAKAEKKDAVADAPAARQPAATNDQPAAAQGNTKQAHGKESLISVNLSKLDHLMAVVSEIVITESMVTASPDLKGLKLDKFTQSARQLRSLTDELQDVSMSLRMVPVSGTFQKMRRIVRDMCKKLNKEATLTLKGEDTEIDKTIVDSISDPIMHIIRNSMDHGIEETAAERVSAGKNPTGSILLSAWHTGSEVIIEVTDDGQGVDDNAVLNKALRQGLAQPGVEYSHKEILNFLLMPGFSTNSEVTEFSGRGVGMDVVKSNVESVGGTVSITSEQGKGMTVTLKIPLTMAIMDGMEVSAGGSVFTVPINNIQQIFRMSEKDIIHDSTRGEMLKIMDNFYSVVRARDFFQLERGVDVIDEGIMLWVGPSMENSFCIFVDELIGEQQVVVKPLPNYINNFGIKSYGIVGCTILGDGNISIILDIPSIMAATKI